MRLSTSAILALPLLTAAAEGPFGQYKAQFQNFLNSFGAKTPTPSKQDPVDTPEVKVPVVGEKRIDVLTLDNWKDTLYSPVKPDATQPEEWWVLITGRNKTCFGHCSVVESAFNASASKFATFSKAPHLAYVNCDDEPILCNSWSASTGALWVFEMLPAPAPIDIYRKRLNLTATTPQTYLDLYTQDSREGFLLYDSWFHPFDGPVAKNGMAVPAAYFFWIFNAIPSWAMMLGISFLSRTMMNRRMGLGPNPAANPAGGAAPRGAPPGDARS